MTPLARVSAVVESAKDASLLDGNAQEVWRREQEKKGKGELCMYVPSFVHVFVHVDLHAQNYMHN